MKFVDRENLPVEVLENELPVDKDKHYQMFYDEKIRTSGGFVDAIFLGAVMMVCFMWGMLAVILK